MKNKVKQPYDCIIVGGGPAGLSLFLRLAQQGMRVACLEGMERDLYLKPGRDKRTTAVSLASAALLQEAGVWQKIQNKACPIKDIVILDENAPVRLDFDSADVGDHPFGWIVDNMDLITALVDQYDALDQGDVLFGTKLADFAECGDLGIQLTLDDGRVLHTQVMIGADGRQSFVRSHWNVPVLEHDYKQTALVGVITHENPHHNLAIEHFRTSGPFAVLPMWDAPDGAHQSTMIWSVPSDEAEPWRECDGAVLNRAVETRLQGRFGAVQNVSLLGLWPLTLNYALKTTHPRTILIADAAHGMHPIAGQGLNMSLRDVSSLSAILPAAKARNLDLGGREVMRQFVRDRRLDNAGMIAATHGLNDLFGIRNKAVHMIRSTGLGMVAALPGVKKFFMRQAMGLGSGMSVSQDLLAERKASKF